MNHFLTAADGRIQELSAELVRAWRHSQLVPLQPAAVEGAAGAQHSAAVETLGMVGCGVSIEIVIGYYNFKWSFTAKL